MATRKYNQNTYVHGQWNAECAVCGFKFKSGDLKERWDGHMVCKDDWEPRHPTDFYRATAENNSVPWVAVPSADAGGTDVDNNTFPPTRTDTTTAIPGNTFNGNEEI